jgi:probable rRNA maturation factor
MSLDVELQVACDGQQLPRAEDMVGWARAAAGAGGLDEPAEMCLRLVDEGEGARLNETYRRRPGATNVLSFPHDGPPGLVPRLLGDVVVCAPLVAREAREQGKPDAAHWAHLVVHGTLHLLGHDHQEAPQAERMEALEREVLAGFGFPDPYASPPP